MVNCGGAAEELSTTESPADNVSETELPQPYAEYVAVLEQILRERTDFVGTDYSDWQDGITF